MDYRYLGKSGLQVPALSFGAGTFGGSGPLFGAWGTTDAMEARRLVDICLEAGVNLFDTADVYSAGASEEILGQAIKGRRDSVLISTEAQETVIALGVIAGEQGADARLLTDGRCRVGDETYELLILRNSSRATAVRDEAQRRAERLAGRGLVEESARFLVAGMVVGPLSAQATDIVEGEVQSDDVFMGQRGIAVELLPAGPFRERAA